MSDKVRQVDYYYVMVPDRPGEAVKLLGRLKEAGVNLLSFTAFPTSAGQSQIDLVPEKAEALLKAAKAGGLALSEKKSAFFIQGKDRAGAVHETLKKLSDAMVNVHAANACCGANGGYGFILWVKPQHVAAAAKALGI